MADRKVIPISVDGAAKATITRVADKHGMKEIAVASRIYEWFSRQDDVVQKGVLRLLPEGYEAEVTKLALERLAAEAQKKPAGKGK